MIPLLRSPFLSALAAGALMVLTLTLPGIAGAQFSLISPEQEKQMGAEEHPKVIGQFGGVYDNVQIGGYVAEIGGRLASHADLPGTSFTFTVLNTPVVNAFALPGGYVYVTRGLVALTNDEAELAGVIAHEIGHVVARHTAQRYSRSVLAQLGAGILGAVTNNADLGRLAEVGSGLYLSSFSREQEYESDSFGVKYLQAAGYDPNAMASFLAALDGQSKLEAAMANQKGSGGLDSLFATHPRTPARIERANELAAGSEGERRRNRHFEQISGMMHGDDPNQGIIDGRRFLHPDMGFAFEVPEGFRLVNSAAAVMAASNGNGAIRFDIETGQLSSTDPATYLQRQWVKNTQLRNVERVTINNMPGATATARVQGQLGDYKGDVDARFVAVRWPNGKMYRLLFLSIPNRTQNLSAGFQRTTYSLRQLTEAEAKAVQPLKLDIVTLRAGDTQESLAARFPFPDFRVERFRALNGLQPGEMPPPGVRVKVVTR